jgi:hypothetical protein
MKQGLQFSYPSGKISKWKAYGAVPRRGAKVAEARLLEWFDKVSQQLRKQRKLTSENAEILNFRERVVKPASDINAGLEALLHDLEAGNITPAEAKKSKKTSREDRSIRRG